METNSITKKAKIKKKIDLSFGVIDITSSGSAIVTNKKEILDCKTENSVGKRNKRKERVSTSVKSKYKNNVAIDLTSHDDDALEESQKSILNSTCLCPASQVSRKKVKRTLKLIKKNGNKKETSHKGKQRDDLMDNPDYYSTVKKSPKEIELSSDESVSDIDSDMIVFSADESEASTKGDKVCWEGYSPLHHIMNGKGKNDEIQRLAKLGHSRKIGKWTSEEEGKLNMNMEEFLDNHHVKDFMGLLFVRTKEDRIFRKRTKFVLKMCKGISRTGCEINNKIFYHFGKSFLNKGKYDDGELEEFRRLHVVYGNSWKKIGMILNRNHRSMSIINNEHQIWYKKGRWSLEEDKLLLSAVVSFKEKNETVSWKFVAEKVKTRSPIHCLHRWSRHHSQITNNDTFENWLTKIEKDNSNDFYVKTLTIDQWYKLITLISEANIDDEFLIEWDDLIKHFDDVPSPAWLKLEFQAICKEVPQSHRLEFPELIEQLLGIYERKMNKDDDDVQIVGKI